MRAEKVRILVRMFDKIGFHVITLPSPTHQNFIVTASATSVPGLITEDATDLYRAMQLAYDQVKAEIEVTAFDLAGYSLGAAQAAFVAKLDDERARVRLPARLLINPPVNLGELGRDPRPPARGQHAPGHRRLHQPVIGGVHRAPTVQQEDIAACAGFPLHDLPAARAQGREPGRPRSAGVPGGLGRHDLSPPT